MSTIPTLTENPTFHPHACLPLSTSLLSLLASHLPFDLLTLSIGSGSGLLELLLQSQSPRLNIEAVEVRSDPPVNVYLPEERIHTVNWTWATHPRGKDASVLLFVYPRSSKLVERYVSEGMGGKLEKVVWMGPEGDWEEYEGVFGRERWQLEVIRKDVLGEGTLLAVSTLISSKTGREDEAG